MGKYLHNPPEPHVCAQPSAQSADAPVVGAIWQCDCGQHYWYFDGCDGNWWKPITARKAKKLLAKIALNEETGTRVHRS
jgi:hypothetical protein